MPIKKMVLCIAAIATVSFSQTNLNTPGTTSMSDISPNGQYLAGLDTLRQVRVFNLSNSSSIVGGKFSNSIDIGGMTLRWTPDGKKILCFIPSKSASSPSGNTFYPASTYIIDVSAYVTEVLDPAPAQKALVDVSKARVYPYPASGSQAISFEIPSAKQARIEIANLKGGIVRILYPESEKTVWDGKNQYGNAVPSGQYIARIISGNTVEAKTVCITD